VHGKAAESVPILHIKPHGQKLTYHVHIRLRVQVQTGCGKRTTPSQRHRQKQLIGKMFIHSRIRCQISLSLPGSIPRNIFRADATLSEGGKNLRQCAALELNHHQVARTHGVLCVFADQTFCAPAEYLSNRVQLAACNVIRQVCD
jgi:hypothetical protein